MAFNPTMLVLWLPRPHQEELLHAHAEQKTQAGASSQGGRARTGQADAASAEGQNSEPL